MSDYIVHPFLRKSFSASTIHYLSLRTERLKEGDWSLSEATNPSDDILAKAAQDINDKNVQDAVYEEIARTNHFAILNAYQGIEGMKWPITKDIYWYFLEILPPIYYRQKTDGFLVGESKCHDQRGREIYSCYYREGEQYWHEYVARG